MTDDVLFLSGEQVTRLLDVDAAIASQRAACTGLGVLTGRATARTGADDIVNHNSVGLGIQDAAAAWAMVRAAKGEHA